MTKSHRRDTAADQKGTVASRPPRTDELGAPDFTGPLAQTETHKIAHAQVQLLAALARIAVEELHRRATDSRSDGPAEP